MTRRARLTSCLVAALLGASVGGGLLPTPADAFDGSVRVQAPRAAPRIEIALRPRATKVLLSGDNRVEARGGARLTRVGRQIHLFLRYRQAGPHRGVKALVGRVVLTGTGPDVRLRQLQVNFTTRRIASVGARGNRIPVLQLVNLHGDDGDGPGFQPDTALILTERGSGLFNRGVGREAFAPGDLVATAEGLA